MNIMYMRVANEGMRWEGKGERKELQEKRERGPVHFGFVIFTWVHFGCQESHLVGISIHLKLDIPTLLKHLCPTKYNTR